MKTHLSSVPWISLGTLLAACACLLAKVNHLAFPDVGNLAVPWWMWPVIFVGGLCLAVGFFFWLGMVGHECKERRGASHLLVAALVVTMMCAAI